MPRVFLYALTVMILGLGIAWRMGANQPQKIPRGQEVTLIATVKNQPKLSERNQIIEIGDTRLFAGLYPKYIVGDRLRVRGFADGEGRIFNAKVEKVGQVPGIWSWVAGLRNRISTNINKFLPAREAALVSGMVLGIDSISQEFRKQLIRTGTIHVVVVSGQNLSIVAGLFLASANLIGRRLSLVLATVAVFAYAFLTGFEPPVVRASLMVLFSSIAIYLGRERIAIWSLILAALIILFFWPQALFEISFQLTFAATFGIMTLGQKIQSSVLGFRLSESSQSVSRSVGLKTDKQKTDKPQSENRQLKTDNRKTVFYPVFNLFITNAAIAVSAYIFTAPIILFYFERISPIAPVVNILVAELVSPIMILGFLIGGTSLIWMPLAQVLAYLAYVPASVFGLIVSLFS